MALSKRVGTFYGDALYHVVIRVSNAKLPEPNTLVEVQSFRDLEHRQMVGAQPYKVSVYTLTGDQCLLTATAQQTAAYDWLKANTDDWSDAVDA